MATIAQCEAYVNETIKVFLQPVSRARGVVDFPTWLHFFTDDAITNVPYGKTTEHPEAEEDVDGILAFMYATSKYHILVAQASGLDYVIRKNPVYMWLNRHGCNGSPSQFSGLAP
jgi:hypothetical protein